MSKINKNRPGYKETKVGWIPEKWKVNRIRDTYKICNNLRFPINKDDRKQIQGDYPYYGPTGILDYVDHYRAKGKYSLIGEDGDHFLKFSLKPQTLLIDGEFNVNNHAHIIKGNKINQVEWFFWYFNHRNIIPFLTRQGANRYKLNKDELGKLYIALPNRQEQKKIAEILTMWNCSIEKLGKLIKLKELRNKGLMQQLLTGKKRLPGFGMPWIHTNLGELIKSVSRPIEKPNHKYLSLGIRSHCKGIFHKIDFDPAKIMMVVLFHIDFQPTLSLL